MILSLSAGLKP